MTTVLEVEQKAFVFLRLISSEYSSALDLCSTTNRMLMGSEPDLEDCAQRIRNVSDHLVRATEYRDELVETYRGVVLGSNPTLPESIVTSCRTYHTKVTERLEEVKNRFRARASGAYGVW